MADNPDRDNENVRGYVPPGDPHKSMRYVVVLGAVDLEVVAKFIDGNCYAT
jgi:hypothetical protein